MKKNVLYISPMQARALALEAANVTSARFDSQKLLESGSLYELEFTTEEMHYTSTSSPFPSRPIRPTTRIAAAPPNASAPERRREPVSDAPPVTHGLFNSLEKAPPSPMN